MIVSRLDEMKVVGRDALKVDLYFFSGALWRWCGMGNATVELWNWSVCGRLHSLGASATTLSTIIADQRAR